MEGPVRSLSWAVRTTRDFDETVVEAQIVSERVLPTLSVLPVVGEAVHDELVDVREGKHSLRGVIQRHGGERDVGIRWLLVAISLSGGSRHCVSSACTLGSRE